MSADEEPVFTDKQGNQWSPFVTLPASPRERLQLVALVWRAASGLPARRSRWKIRVHAVRRHLLVRRAYYSVYETHNAP